MNRFGNVEISENEISEYDGDRRAIIIPKEKTKQIYMLYGSCENQPLGTVQK